LHHLPPLFDTKMLVLYETAMGYCLFKVSDAAKLNSADLWKEFESPEKANKLYVVILV
jgi:nucleolar protein 58